MSDACWLVITHYFFIGIGILVVFAISCFKNPTTL
jgi:hypothetical protein